MWEQSFELETREVTPSQIWQSWSDINRWSDWDDGIEYARTNEPFGVGCRFVLKPKGGPNVQIRIVECVPGSHFVDLTEFPLAKMFGRHEMTVLPNGVVKLKTTIKVTGPLGFLWRRLVAQKIVNDLPLDTEKLIASAKKRKA